MCILYRVCMTGIGDTGKGEETRCMTRFGYGAFMKGAGHNPCTVVSKTVIHAVALGRCLNHGDRA